MIEPYTLSDDQKRAIVNYVTQFSSKAVREGVDELYPVDDSGNEEAVSAAVDAFLVRLRDEVRSLYEPVHPKPRVFCDFNNADKRGMVRLSLSGSLPDLAKIGTRLRDGLPVIVTDRDEHEADGIVRLNAEEVIWVAEIDWTAIRRVEKSQ